MPSWYVMLCEDLSSFEEFEQFDLVARGFQDGVLPEPSMGISGICSLPGTWELPGEPGYRKQKQKFQGPVIHNRFISAC